MKLEYARDLLRLRFAAWRDQLTASDPEQLRFRYAARITLSMALALFVLLLLVFLGFVGQDVPVILLGVAMSFQASFVVDDPEPRQQRLTTLLLPLSAAAAATLGALLAPLHYLGDAGFVGAAFASVYVRRFGPRGVALGMIGFIAYFYTLFSKLALSQLPWAYLAILLGMLCGYLMNFVILPYDPEEKLERALRAFDARVSQIIEAVSILLFEADDDGEIAGLRRRGTLRRLTDELGDTALRAEAQLNASPLRTEVRPELFIKLFDLELAARRLVNAGTDGLGIEDQRSKTEDADKAPPREKLLPVLRRLRRVLHLRGRGRSGDGLEPGLLQDLPEDRLGLAVRDLAAAIAAMPAPGRGDEWRTDAGEGSSPRDVGVGKGASGGGLSPYTRQAIQVALASALAITGGEIISPSRWYWAAFTGFIIFIGMNSRSEVMVRGGQRMLGTFVGVAAGILVANAIHGEPKVALLLILVCAFLALYFFRVSYTLMIFWFTILLALLYVVLGYYHPHMLMVRLEEVALGAAVGIAVALWVLPARTMTEVAEAGRKFLSALESAVECFAHQLLDPTDERPGEDDKDDGGMTAKLRELDGDLQKLRVAAASRTRGFSGAVGGSSVRRWLRTLVGFRYEAHGLAQQRQLSQLPLPARRVLTRLALRLRDDIRALPEEGSGSSGHLRGAELCHSLRGAPPDAAEQALAAARALRCMEQAVSELRELGAEGRRLKKKDRRTKIED
jgi:uncharacterized membrane protein YccC